MSDQGELIFFKVPNIETTLFIENLHPSTTGEEMVEYFSKFGLLYEVKLFEIEGSNNQFAFVKYYAKIAATSALNDLKNHKFRGMSCRGSFAKERKQRSDYPLDIHRSLELANYYLGFNEWSTSILSLSQELLEYHEDTLSYKCTYSCHVRLTVKDGRHVEAVGKGTYGGKDKSNVINFAKKNALTEARKNVFQSMVIILLPSGKSTVHFLNDSLEAWE